MTMSELVDKLNKLPTDQANYILPFLEADIAAAEHLDDLKRSIEAGRTSAQTQPLLNHSEVIAQARRSIR